MSRCFGDVALVAARVATGRLGWSVEAFWASTAAELVLALAGAAGDGAPQVEPLAGAELARLRERLGDG